MTVHPVLFSSRAYRGIQDARARIESLDIGWLLGQEATEEAVFAALFPGWQAHRIPSPQPPTSFGFRIFCAPDDDGCVFGPYAEGADWLGKDPWGNIPPQAHAAVDFLTGTLDGMRGADTLAAFVAHIHDILGTTPSATEELVPFLRLSFEFWLDRQPLPETDRAAIRLLAALGDYRDLPRLLIEHTPRTALYLT